MRALNNLLIQATDHKLNNILIPNTRIKMEGIQFLKMLNDTSVPVCFFDPQYRGILDKMKYGNEGKKRGRARASLKQMDDSTIKKFIKEIDRVLCSSGHLFLWIDKFHLCSGFDFWMDQTSLETVDMITWDKGILIGFEFCSF